ncbi:MAG: hypothetical protein ISS31_10620 [Kiritimatiellae bacterium]|nr:hypothetical protein [Kiritimatiellia bacterium]
MKPYEPRLIDALIERKLKTLGAVVLRGPRAVGKTTTALHHADRLIEADPFGRPGRRACRTA